MNYENEYKDALKRAKKLYEKGTITESLAYIFPELKEVYLDLDYIKKELDEVIRIYKPNGNFGWGTLYNVATHFFKLGLKAQKGE